MTRTWPYATGKLTVTNAPPASNAARPRQELRRAPPATKRYWRDRSTVSAVGPFRDAIGELQERANGCARATRGGPYVRWLSRRGTRRREPGGQGTGAPRNSCHRARGGAAGGALPGWLRDGVELEPKDRPYQEPAKRPPHDDGD